jgi:hypothetical protein
MQSSSAISLTRAGRMFGEMGGELLGAVARRGATRSRSRY